MPPNQTSQNNMGGPHKEGSAGPVIGTIIILAVIILGGLYFWMARDNAVAPTTDQSTAAITSQSTSDDTSSIESDLNNTKTYDIDANLQAS